jgi:Thiamine monophosphate synthase
MADLTQIPRLYAIVDAAFFPTAQSIFGFAEELVAGGCTLLQFRNKGGSPRVMLEQARELRRRCGPHPNVAKSAPLGWGTRQSGILCDPAGLVLYGRCQPVRDLMRDLERVNRSEHRGEL